MKKLTVKELNPSAKTNLFFIDSFDENKDGYCLVFMDYLQNYRKGNIILVSDSENKIEAFKQYSNIIYIVDSDSVEEDFSFKVDRIFWKSEIRHHINFCFDITENNEITEDFVKTLTSMNKSFESNLLTNLKSSEYAKQSIFIFILNQLMNVNKDCSFYLFMTEANTYWNFFEQKYQKRFKALYFETDKRGTRCFDEFPIAQLQHLVYEKLYKNKESLFDSVDKKQKLTTILCDSSNMDFLNDKIYAYLAKDILPLVDYEYDPTFKQIPDYFYQLIGVKDANDIKEKIEFFESNPEAYNLLLKKMKVYYEIDSDIWKTKESTFDYLDKYFA